MTGQDLLVALAVKNRTPGNVSLKVVALNFFKVQGPIRSGSAANMSSQGFQSRSNTIVTQNWKHS